MERRCFGTPQFAGSYGVDDIVDGPRGSTAAIRRPNPSPETGEARAARRALGSRPAARCPPPAAGHRRVNAGSFTAPAPRGAAPPPPRPARPPSPPPRGPARAPPPAPRRPSAGGRRPQTWQRRRTRYRRHVQNVGAPGRPAARHGTASGGATAPGGRDQRPRAGGGAPPARDDPAHSRRADANPASHRRPPHNNAPRDTTPERHQRRPSDGDTRRRRSTRHRPTRRDPAPPEPARDTTATRARTPSAPGRGTARHQRERSAPHDRAAESSGKTERTRPARNDEARHEQRHQRRQRRAKKHSSLANRNRRHGAARARSSGHANRAARPEPASETRTASQPATTAQGEKAATPVDGRTATPRSTTNKNANQTKTAPRNHHNATANPHKTPKRATRATTKRKTQTTRTSTPTTPPHHRPALEQQARAKRQHSETIHWTADDTTQHRHGHRSPADRPVAAPRRNRPPTATTSTPERRGRLHRRRPDTPLHPQHELSHGAPRRSRRLGTGPDNPDHEHDQPAEPGYYPTSALPFQTPKGAHWTEGRGNKPRWSSSTSTPTPRPLDRARAAREAEPALHGKPHTHPPTPPPPQNPLPQQQRRTLHEFHSPAWTGLSVASSSPPRSRWPPAALPPTPSPTGTRNRTS